MQQEEEAKTHQGSNGSNKGSSTPSSTPGSQQNNQHHVTKWKQETSDMSGQEGSAGEYGEYIDMDMEDDCASDVDSET